MTVHPLRPGSVSAVLIVPAEGDPEGFLEYGVGGSAPPTAYLSVTRAVAHEECHDCDSGPHTAPDGGWETHCGHCDERWPCPEAGVEISPRREAWTLAPTLQAHRHLFLSKGEALVLAWGGKVVYEGMDRLARRYMEYENTDKIWMEGCLDVEHVKGIAKAVTGWADVRVVFLDADGNEVEHG